MDIAKPFLDPLATCPCLTFFEATYYRGKINGLRVVMLKDGAIELTDQVVAVWQLYLQDFEAGPDIGNHHLPAHGWKRRTGVRTQAVSAAIPISPAAARPRLPGTE
jgi:hypothetical protein